jgi:hypothetical protein
MCRNGWDEGEDHDAGSPTMFWSNTSLGPPGQEAPRCGSCSDDEPPEIPRVRSQAAADLIGYHGREVNGGGALHGMKAGLQGSEGGAPRDLEAGLHGIWGRGSRGLGAGLHWSGVGFSSSPEWGKAELHPPTHMAHPCVISQPTPFLPRSPPSPRQRGVSVAGPSASLGDGYPYCHVVLLCSNTHTRTHTHTLTAPRPPAVSPVGLSGCSGWWWCWVGVGGVNMARCGLTLV